METNLARLAAVLLALVVIGGCDKHLVQNTRSMEPTIRRGETITVHMRWRWGGRRIPRGTLVYFPAPGEDETSYYVKRVVGVGGDTIQIKAGELLVNGKVQHEPYVADDPRKAELSFGPMTVPEGSVFVLGDNRALSMDSRRYGAIPESEVWGTVDAERPARAGPRRKR